MQGSVKIKILGVAGTLPRCHNQSWAKFYLGPRGHAATQPRSKIDTPHYMYSLVSLLSIIYLFPAMLLLLVTVICYEIWNRIMFRWLNIQCICDNTLIVFLQFFCRYFIYAPASEASREVAYLILHLPKKQKPISRQVCKFGCQHYFCPPVFSLQN